MLTLSMEKVNILIKQLGGRSIKADDYSKDGDVYTYATRLANQHG